MQFTCITCSQPVQTGKFTWFYAVSTSRIHAIARYEAPESRVPSLAGCNLTNLHFAGEFVPGVIADCLQLQVFLCAFAGIFACVCIYFCPHLEEILLAILVFLPANGRYFCLQKQALLHARRGQICMSFACKITCKIPILFR